jgi:STE24 endopeptidase
MKRVAPLALGLVLWLAVSPPLAAQQMPAQVPATPPAAESLPPIPAAARASARFDATAATDAYLATVPPDTRARSNAYFEGGYWLMLWSFLISVAVCVAFLVSGWSARLRDLAERATRFRPVHTFAYWTMYFVLSSLAVFPFTVYQGFVREHQYELATQGFGSWFGDQLKALVLGIVLGGLFVVVIYAVLRRTPRSWWIWGGAVSLVFAALGALIAPVFLFPLFNTYTRLDDPRVTAPILSMARANGIPASDVYMVNASRQSTRVSANVSGFLGTERITLNDNLLNRASLPEIEAVMGHEMGHYVLNHVYKGLLFAAVIIVVGFAVLYRGSAWALARWGDRWRLRGVDDVAALPLLVLIFTIYSFVLTPLANTWTRTEEYEADIFGLNAARQPDGMALVSLKLGDYRKLDPGPVEEILFFDHPSGRTRIHAAMRWKAEHLQDAR